MNDCETCGNEHAIEGSRCRSCKGKELEALQSEISTLQEKGYSWCNRCGCLVVGDVNHPCDKCGNHDLEHFVVDVELLRLREKLRWHKVEDKPVPKDGKEYLCINKRQGFVKQLVFWDKVHKRWKSKDCVIVSMQHTHWREIDLPTGEQESK